MLGHVLIAAALVFVLNLTGSTVDFVSSLTPDSQLAVVAGPGTTPRTEPPKKDTCKRGHTYEVVVDARTGEVSTKDRGVDLPYQYACARYETAKKVCTEQSIGCDDYRTLSKSSACPVNARVKYEVRTAVSGTKLVSQVCPEGTDIVIAQQAVVAKGAGIAAEEQRYMDSYTPRPGEELTAEKLAALSKDPQPAQPQGTVLSDCALFSPESCGSLNNPLAPPTGKFSFEELDRLAGNQTKPSPEQNGWGDLFFGGPSVALNSDPPSGPGEPGITHTDDEIAARSRFPEPAAPSLTSEGPKTLTERMGESAMKMLDGVDRWWEDFGKDTQDAATKQEEARQDQTSADKNKTVEPNWEALRIEQGGDWAEARNALEDEQKAVTGDSRTPTTQADLDARRAEVVNRGIALLEGGNEKEVRDFNITEELKRLDEKYYVAPEPARASVQDEIARIQAEADQKMAALEAKAKQDKFEVEVSGNIDREDASTGAAMRESLAVAEAKEAERVAREKEFSENIDRYESELGKVKIVDERNLNTNFGYPIDPTVGAEQCVGATNRATCTTAYVEFEKARSRQQALGGTTPLNKIGPMPVQTARPSRPAPEPSPISYEGIRQHFFFGPMVRYVEENAPKAYDTAKEQIAQWYESSPIAAWRSPEPSFAERAGDAFSQNQNAPGNAVSEQLLREGQRRLAETPFVTPSLPSLVSSDTINGNSQRIEEKTAEEDRRIPPPTWGDLWESITQDDIRRGLDSFEDFSNNFSRWVDSNIVYPFVEFWKPKPLYNPKRK